MRSSCRRTTLAAALAALAVLAAACGSSAPDSHPPTTRGGEPEVVRASVRRAAADPTDQLAAAAIVGRVAAQLYEPIVTGASGNAVFSPASIASALALLRAGGRGASAAQLDRFFGSADGAHLDQAMNGLDRTVTSSNGERTTKSERKGTVRLVDANALWGQRGISWERPFLETLAASYGAGMRVVDYAQADTARHTINAWIAEQTHGKIPQLIPAGALDASSRMTLTNAMWFKAPWEHELRAVGRRPFTTPRGAKVQAPMMSVEADLHYAKGAGWQAVQLPYAGRELAMTLVVPDAGQLPEVERSLTAAGLARLLATPSAARVDLTMPTFDLRTKSLLGEVLQALGVRAPFSADTTDFTPMSHDPRAQPLYVGQVRHEATVTVDEKGTEAAAATSVEMKAGSVSVPPNKPVVLTIDRPFIFVIHDVANGTPLFVGRVANPLEK
ncbi:MAG: Serpin [Acidimicrobiales bacterium]|nr:Serpin [Acidimicrobiales bacterium]